MEKSIGLDETIQQPSSDDKTKPRGKKRLSRKEQKARKKQREAKSTRQSQVPIQPAAVQQAEKKTEFALENYQPVPIPDSLHPSGGASSLGKWFPKAKVIKSSVSYSNDFKSTNAKASLILFYQYVTPPWPESRVSQLLAYLAKIAETRRTLGGRIRVAPEGVNATVSSVDFEGMGARTTLEHFCQDLVRFDKVFEATDFKFIDEQPPDRHFKDLKLLPVKELVFYGLQDSQAPLHRGGAHLEPTDFHILLEEDPKDTVVVDVQNHYEAAIGQFDGGSAEYVDPKMCKSTNFSTWLNKPETRKKLKDKKVLMYCMGGVRCE